MELDRRLQSACGLVEQTFLRVRQPESRVGPSRRWSDLEGSAILVDGAIPIAGEIALPPVVAARNGGEGIQLVRAPALHERLPQSLYPGQQQRIPGMGGRMAGIQRDGATQLALRALPIFLRLEGNRNRHVCVGGPVVEC